MNRKYLLILLIFLFNMAFLAVAILPNLYLLGGINFPSKAFGSAYGLAFSVVIYGGGLLIPPITALLVRRFDLGYVPILLLNAIPIASQAVAFVLYMIFGDVYGYICC